MVWGSYESTLLGSTDNILEGLYCYNTKTGMLKSYQSVEGDSTTISHKYINCLYEDSTGMLWIGTNGGGLCSFDKQKQKFKRYPYSIGNAIALPQKDALDDAQASGIVRDKNVLWISTFYGGLNKLNLETGHFETLENILPGFSMIDDLYYDGRNKLWAGTYQNGLFEINTNNESIKKIKDENDLLPGGAWQIESDGAGNIWTTSGKGITIYNTITNNRRVITKASGLPAKPSHCLYKANNGDFFYSCNGGFVSFNPNDFKPDTITPIVHIETLTFNKPQSKNKTIDSTIVRYGKSKIDLKYDENRIMFNYVGLIYQNVDQVKYKYKLDGYDNHWINAGTQRTATYTNLDPGTYTFYVTAANSDGVWSKKEDAVTIIIAPPFWQTWWFRTLVILSISGVIYFVTMYFIRQKLKAQQQEFARLNAVEQVRTKISMDIHDEISSGLTKISLLSQRVKTKYERSKEVEGELIDKISDSSKEVINNLGEIIWAVNPKHDNLQSLLAYIRNYTVNFFEPTSLQLTINFPETIKEIAVSPEIKHNLFLVVKEALNNIIKHADATVAEVSFTYNDQSYQFTIKDNGKGMVHVNGNGFGNGFVNMRKRMQSIGGSIIIKSEKNSGTKLELAGKFDNEVIS